MRVLSKRVSIQICDPQFRLRGKKKEGITFSELWIRCLVTCDSCDGCLCVSPDSTRVIIYMRTQRESLNIYMCDQCCIYFTYALFACTVLPFRSWKVPFGSLLWFVWVLCCHKLHLG